MTTPIEMQALAKVAERYRARGYTVELHPEASALPDFLEGFQPDLIARGPTESVLVELKVGTKTAVADRLRSVADRISRENGWRLSLVFVDPINAEISESDPLSLPLVAERIRNAAGLARDGQTEAAFLLFWSALEGLLRTLAARVRLPVTNLPTSALIRELYSAGELSREQFDLLLGLLPTRNELVHGFGSTNGLDVGPLQRIIETLMAETAPASA